MSENKTKFIGFRVSKDLYKQVDDTAYKKRMTVSEYARQVLEKDVKKENKNVVG